MENGGSTAAMARALSSMYLHTREAKAKALFTNCHSRRNKNK
jgi:hypothetical protein